MRVCAFLGLCRVVIQGWEQRARCICSRCGSALVSSLGGIVTEVAPGTVDGDPGVRPGEHIVVGSRAAWYEIADALPQFEEWPPGVDG